jgi:zinc-binding alcohol dehydrogenase/oxidoreductase
MKALVFSAADAPLTVQDWPEPQPKEGEIVVDVAAAALNHRDVWITKGLYPGIRFPAIMGSDGAGWLEGKCVVFNPSFNWGDNPAAQGKDYHILGLPTQGTFATRLAIPASHVAEAPTHLSMEEAAALPLAGLTAYRALFTRAALRAEEKVLIGGIGGGVALFAMQFALAHGAEVFVTSGSDEKIARAMEMGARGGANYRQENWANTLKSQAGGFDVVIDGAGGPGFADLVSLLNPGGRIAIYGATKGTLPELNPRTIFWRQLSILGSTMGHERDFSDMIDFVAKHRITPVVDQIFPLEEGQAAFNRMAEGRQFGKILLRLRRNE